MFCENCGRKIDDNAVFCNYCGAKVRKAKLTSKTDRNPKESNVENSIAEDGLHEENSKHNRDESFLKNINQFHVLKFIYYQIKELHFTMFLYFAAIIYVTYLLCFSESESSYDPSVSLGSLITVLLLNLVICHFFLNGVGQKMLLVSMGAKKIERYEYIESLQKPVEQIIDIVRNEGLDLPEKINIYYCDSDRCFAYAVGMNSIVVSTEMIDLRDDLFEAKIRTELYRINHMCPDYLLFFMGSNFSGLIISIFILLVLGFGKRYGSTSKGLFESQSERESSAMLFYIVLFLCIAWVALSYCLVMIVIRSDILKADKYVADCGYGEAQCIYLDNVPRSPHAKIFELGYPSEDKRIAALQGMGVQYSYS